MIVLGSFPLFAASLECERAIERVASTSFFFADVLNEEVHEEDIADFDKEIEYFKAKAQEAREEAKEACR